jgi:hypothetical protein
MLVMAAPAAANSKPTTGPRISLDGPPAEFDANAPFYVRHGFACDKADASCISALINGTSGFDLYVDGVLQKSSVVVDVGDGFINKRYLTNFPNGLPAGDHTFVGVWSVRGIVVQTRTAAITFT